MTGVALTVGVQPIAPLDAQFGVLDKETLPSELAPVLAWPLTALIDGALVPGLEARLAASGLDHACLFMGDLTPFAGAAPWLVRLARDAALTRALFTAEGQPQLALWPLAAMLLVAADLPVAALRAHFRRFLRVPGEGGAPQVFRFWEPATAPAYFAGLADRPATVARWFRPREGGAIAALWVPRTDPAAVVRIAPEGPGLTAAPEAGAFRLTDGDLATLARARAERDIRDLQRLLARTFPDRLAAVPPDEADRATRRTLSRMLDYGFTQRDHLFTLLAWDLHFGPAFENADPEGLRAICESPLPEADKFALLRDRMDAIG